MQYEYEVKQSSNKKRLFQLNEAFKFLLKRGVYEIKILKLFQKFTITST